MGKDGCFNMPRPLKGFAALIWLTSRPFLLRALLARALQNYSNIVVLWLSGCHYTAPQVQAAPCHKRSALANKTKPFKTHTMRAACTALVNQSDFSALLVAGVVLQFHCFTKSDCLLVP